MAVPRTSQSTEAARAAALQAEFNEKKWVWVPDARDGYASAWIINEAVEHVADVQIAEVIMAAGGEARRLDIRDISRMNPPKFDRVDDIADLTHLNEASVVHNLRLRYGSGAIYTYSGLFLVAINPYQPLPLYSDAVVQQYRGKRRVDNPPHIFAIAERAWINMGEERENQSILITGESGAGKTESTKKVIQYLAAIATDTQLPSTPSLGHTQTPSTSASSIPAVGLPRSSSFRSTHGHTKSTSSTSFMGGTTSKGRLGLLERQILQANPILEAFGNAQTQRNNNSSRFGKFIRISFAPDGSIAGANIDWYLLEKSRVVVRSEAERSFHVFYQIMEAHPSLRETLLLDGGVEDYEYLNKSRREVDGVDDREEWRLLKNALDVVGFTESEQFDLFRIVAAILHLGNIEITSTRADDALMPDISQAERACHLLGIPVQDFTRAVLRPRVLAGREWVTQARTKQQALDELSALCKTLYEKSFGQLVERINRALDRPSSKSTFIGVLDIAGFEIFDTNGYEQLLINYTNEKLQQFFNYHMFTLEQEEYARESIEWDYVNFGLDLQPTIDLIESSGSSIGILSVLDEECIMPKASDLTFTNKVSTHWALDPSAPEEDQHLGRQKFFTSRFEQGFLIKHYAGDVEYRTDGWLEKNKDPLNDNISRVMAMSSERYIASLFSDYAGMPDPSSNPSTATLGKKRMLKKGAFRTVGQRHKEQLASLMAQLRATQPHFVRCIVPNPNKKPGRMDVPLVLDQLRCNGVLEGIRIARLGYPNRLPFVEFRQRYEVLTPGIIQRGYMDGRKACERMVVALELDESQYKIGTSKVFFKAGVLAELEEQRDALLYDIFSRIQAMARKWTARRSMKKILNRAIAIRTIQRNARQYNELREWPWWQLYTKVRPLLAATRNDEELRKKDVELALVRERAERDQKEKEALESLKMRLESEKRKVEDNLEAERALALDKDTLLERSKTREAELEEEVVNLQADLDELESQLDRALKLQADMDEKHKALQQAFDQAAEHLVRMESEQHEWAGRETDLAEQMSIAQTDSEALRTERDALLKASEELKNLVVQREEDLARAKERMEATIADLDAKLSAEVRNRDSFRTNSEALDKEARLAKEQVAELARTATDYSTHIQKLEAEMENVTADLDQLAQERDKLAKYILELEGQIQTISAELDAERGEGDRTSQALHNLQAELDELRTLLQAKSSEETRRSEAAKSKEAELANLRAQASQMQQDLAEARKSALEGQNKLKVELDSSLRDYKALQSSHQSLLDRERDVSAKLKNAEVALSEAEKIKRSAESELQSVRSRHLDLDSQLAEALRAKETLERQVHASQVRSQEFEDVNIELEREKSAQGRQLEVLKAQLDAETKKRGELEKHASAQKKDLIMAKDRGVKLDRELQKALTDLKNREWEVKQLKSRQDTTIVEHVHVLEEAKRRTDRQLKDIQEEVRKQESYIRSLEKSKRTLTNENEDMIRATDQERLEIRAKEKAIRAQEERASRALADVEKERRTREAVELQVRRLQADLEMAQNQTVELEDQLTVVARSKANLENELERLVEETDAPTSLASMQRQYEARIANLEQEVEDAKTSQAMAARVREQVDRQHAELRRLIMGSNPQDDDFRSRLLEELRLADERMEREFVSRNGTKGSMGRHSLGNLPPSTPPRANGSLRAPKSSAPDLPRTPERNANADRQAAALRQQVQVLEVQMAASDRVRKHLEVSLRELSADLDNSDGSKQHLQRCQARLSKEKARLKELLDDEAQARRAADANQMDGVQAMWNKFKDTMAVERESYNRLEESRKALVVQQRNAQMELESSQRQLRELAGSKKQLQSEISAVKDQLESEIAAKNEEAAAKRQLQLKLQEVEMSTNASESMHGELAEAVKGYKVKADSYLARLQETEIDKVKAERAEALARRALANAEKAHADAVAEQKLAEDRLQEMQVKLREVEQKLEEDTRDSSDVQLLHQRFEEEMDDERKQHQQDIEERDFTIDQTRKKYQAELAGLSEELQGQRESMTRLREENRTLRSDYDELQLRYDDEVYSGGAWKNEKQRLETKIGDLNKAYDASTAAQGEQQTQIVSLHAQVRELRGVLNDAEADRVLLQRARRALQDELEGIKSDSNDTSRMSSDREVQMLQLQKQDLQRTLEQQEDRVTMAMERVKKADAYASESQAELMRIRVENSELDKMNTTLEKQIKDLNLRIVDLETKSYANSPRPAATSRRLENRIDELTSQLNQTSRDRTDSLRMQRTVDKTVRDTQSQLAEADRQRTRLEEEVKSYDAKVQSMRQAMDDLSTREHDLELARRRAEREAADHKQKTLSLEREVERLRSRLDRPAGSFASPHNSPRKFAPA